MHVELVPKNRFSALKKQAVLKSALKIWQKANIWCLKRTKFYFDDTALGLKVLGEPKGISKSFF